MVAHLDRQHEHEHEHLGLGIKHRHIHHHSGYHNPGDFDLDSDEHADTRHSHSVDHGDVIREKTPRPNGNEHDVIDAALYLGSVMEALANVLRGPSLATCPICEDVAGLGTVASLLRHVTEAHLDAGVPA